MARKNNKGFNARPTKRKHRIRARVYAAYDNQCAWCFEDDVTKLTIDHILPSTFGGTHAIANLQPLCQSCNNLKGDALPAEAEAIRQRLAQSDPTRYRSTAAG